MSKIINIVKRDFMFYVSLLWMAFPIYYSIAGFLNVDVLVLTLLMLVCYIASLYVWNELLSKTMWIYMCFYVVCVVSFASPVNVMCFMYLSSILTYRYEDINLKSFRNITFFLTSAILLLIILLRDIGENERLVSFVLLSVCFFMHLAGRMEIIQRKNKEKLYKQNEHINNLLAENERNRIGRDLHDTLGHVFALLTLKSELATKLIDKGYYEEAKKEILELNDVTKTSMTKVREIVANLKFVSIAEELTISGETLALANIKLNVVKKTEFEKLNPTMQSVVAMILRECANNIIKHSRATETSWQFFNEDYSLVVEVSDNGVGFTNVKGTELATVKERLKLVGGSIEIVSVSKPTTIKLVLPYERS